MKGKKNRGGFYTKQIVVLFILIIVLLICTLGYHTIYRIDVRKPPILLEKCKNVNKIQLIKTIEILRSDKKTEYFKYLSDLKSTKRNKARIAHGQCVPPVKDKGNSNETQFILLTNFIPYFEKAHRDNNLILQTRPATDEEIDARLYELVTTLEGNLKHAHIKTVYVFVNTVAAVKYLHWLNLSHSKNLVIQHEVMQYTFKTFVQYFSDCLQDELVIIGQQDILLGKGWDKVSYKIMSENRLMYALTRHPAFQSSCYYTTEASANCKSGKYFGSHDVFAYHVKNLFSPKLLALLDIQQNKFGMENVFIWVFIEKLKYTVTNPCSILYAHHQHCVPLRAKNKNRARVNNATTTGLAVFTDKLTP